MSELILIRHAQASFGHENYDNLSDLGHDQAALLGSLFDKLNIAPDRVVIGTQKRHQQTLENFNLKCQVDKHPGWNEYDFRDLLLAEFGLALISRKRFLLTERPTLKLFDQR